MHFSPRFINRHRNSGALGSTTQNPVAPSRWEISLMEGDSMLKTFPKWFYFLLWSCLRRAGTGILKAQLLTNWGYNFLTNSDTDSLPHTPFFTSLAFCFTTELPENLFFKAIQLSHRITTNFWCFALSQARNDAEVGAGRTNRRHRQKEPSLL